MSNFTNELEKTILEQLQMYVEKEYVSQLVSIMQSSNTSPYASIAVDSMNLFESNIAFAHYIFQNPRNALKLLDDAFQKVALNISKTHTLRADMVYKGNLHVRLIALPNLPEVYRSSLPSCSDVGQFLCISGTVIRASTARMLQFKKLWRCSKCKYQFTVEADVEQGYICEKPLVCSNPEWCSGKNFTLMSTDINPEWCKDYQEIKLQEQVYNLNVGTVPRTMWVILENDLVESCHPGNDVIVSGVLIQRWKPLIKSHLIDIDLMILAHNIEVQNNMPSGVVSKDMIQEFGQFWQDHRFNPLTGRNFILSSICPQVFGLYIVKLAVALILASGVQKKDGSSRIRGDSHLLLIGDPGTAKSQFLKFASKVSSRSVITSGIGTTNAGLTVSAVKESGRWQLEAGALVLADGGICCIDEFSCIKEQDKTCIHEAMEQQTISVAKAGLVCSLNTRCSILAATNPKGKYDEHMSISENTALGTPLLSRFDIILVLLDSYDEKWDEMVSSYILEGRNFANEGNDKLWSVSKMKNYFSLIHHINPKVMPGAERVMQAYYTKQRSLQSRNASRTTPRLLQSLIRLAEGHARLMFRSEVLVSDAIIAIILMESSMLGNSILEDLRPLHTIFPEDPNAELEKKAKIVLQNLNLELPTKENFERFYQESSIEKLLKDISSVWHSKDYPYIFGSSQSNIPSNNSLFGESNVNNDSFSSVLHANDTINERDGIASGELYNSCMIGDNLGTTSSQWPDHNKVRNNHNINSNSYHNSNMNIQDNDAIPNKRHCSYYSVKAPIKKNVSTLSTSVSNFNTQNMSVLHQVLNEPNLNNNSHTTSSFTNCAELKDKLSTISELRNIFCENTSLTSHKTNSVTESCVNNFSGSQSQRNISILEELVLSPEKQVTEQNEVENKNCDAKSKAFDFSFQNIESTSKFFPAKRSLADQLKSFAFSKSRKNFQTDFASNNHEEANNELIQNSRHTEKLCDNSKQPRVAYDVGKINKDNGFSTMISDFSNNHNEPQVAIKIDKDSSNSLKHEYFETKARNAEHSSVNEQSEIVSSSKKKEIPDNLKKFIFTKTKASKDSRQQ